MGCGKVGFPHVVSTPEIWDHRVYFSEIHLQFLLHLLPALELQPVDVHCHYLFPVALLPNQTTPTMLRAHQSDLVEHGSLPLTGPTLLLFPLLSVSSSLTFTDPYMELTRCCCGGACEFL